MNRQTISLALVLAATTVACDGVTEPEPQFSMNAAEAPAGMVPIQIHETAFTPAVAIPMLCEPAPAGVALPDRLLASGVTSHLGRVSTVVLGTGCAVDLITGVISISGTAARTAANGDVLLGTWTGTLAGSVLTLDATFTGGTGRFRSATGWASGRGKMYSATGTGEWTLIGRISPPAH